VSICVPNLCRTLISGYWRIINKDRRSKMAGKRTMKLASRGKRFGAACIDMVVPVFAYIVVMIVTHGAGLGQTMPYGYGFGNDFGSGFGYGYGYGYPYGMRVSGAAIAAMIFLSLILIAYMVVQFVFFSKSKSIGKSMLGLQVVSSRDGKPLGFWRMMLRECIVKSADSPLLLGYIDPQHILPGGAA